MKMVVFIHPACNPLKKVIASHLIVERPSRVSEHQEHKIIVIMMP